VGKIVMICAVIILGIFAFFAIKNNAAKPKLAAQNAEISTPSTKPVQNQDLDIKAAKTSSQSSQAQTIDEAEATSAIIKTTKGDIEITFYSKDAPNTVSNFVKLAKKGFYNGLIFHRVIKGFMIQGGDPTGTGMGGPGYKFDDELNPKSPSYKAGYKKGIVAMANSGPDTNGSQFFIMLADYPLPNNYTIFGKVIKGQEVVDEIGSVQTDPNDKPTTPVKMGSIVIRE
jgi:cyclophilin family peptidyl-prolyl cis-trans isomerase